MSSKFLKTTRTPEEHLDNLLTIRDAKAHGKSDKEIVKDLSISFTTLQQYKEYLATLDKKQLDTLDIKTMRFELDAQVQGVIRRLYEVTDKLDALYNQQTDETKLLLTDPSINYLEKYKLTKSLRYPVGDLSTIQRLLLSAIELRVRIWGLANEVPMYNQEKTTKKFVFKVTRDLTEGTDKIEQIADMMVESNGGLNGMQLQEE
jgi:hypothetical protein